MKNNIIDSFSILNASRDLEHWPWRIIFNRYYINYIQKNIRINHYNNNCAVLALGDYEIYSLELDITEADNCKNWNPTILLGFSPETWTYLLINDIKHTLTDEFEQNILNVLVTENVLDNISKIFRKVISVRWKEIWVSNSSNWRSYLYDLRTWEKVFEEEVVELLGELSNVFCILKDNRWWYLLASLKTWRIYHEIAIPNPILITEDRLCISLWDWEYLHLWHETPFKYRNLSAV